MPRSHGNILSFLIFTLQIYQGEWYDDQPRCGEFRSPTAEEETRFVRLLPKGMFHNEFKLPGLTLADPTGIIDIAVSDVRMQSIRRSHASPEDGAEGIYSTQIPAQSLERARKVFHGLTNGNGNSNEAQTISIYRLADVLYELGLSLTAADITEIVTQLELKDTLDVSFSEAVEIASYIHEQKLTSQHQSDDFY